jgi:threonine aldolase
MADLASGLAELADRGVTALNRPDVNMLFVELPGGTADALEAGGVLFYRMGRGPGGGDVVRFVTSWQTTPDEVVTVVERVAAAVTA